MIVAIIQARMASKRLPGKVLKKIGGMPLLAYQLKRLDSAHLINKVVVATSVNEEDDQIEDFCRENNIECFRGSQEDVLSRYYECARQYNADVVVRLTADCPLSDPKVIDEAVKLYKSGDFDFVANTVPINTSKYPDGSDVEIFSMKALERANNECIDKHDREHVTFYFWKYDNNFRKTQLDCVNDYSKYRFTVDYPEDFEVVEFIIRKLAKTGRFGHIEEIVEIINSNPQIKAKNAKYYSGIGWEQ